MAETNCGFRDGTGIAASDLLVTWGPTLMVNIGFDPAYNPNMPGAAPQLANHGIEALVDTGATECCIDSLLATQLNLPVIDRRRIGGVGGAQEVNMHLAQIYVPPLGHTIYGGFAGVHLAAGGQMHKALIGRTFLKSFKMIYDGKTGQVIISS